MFMVQVLHRRVVHCFIFALSFILACLEFLDQDPHWTGGTCRNTRRSYVFTVVAAISIVTCIACYAYSLTWVCISSAQATQQRILCRASLYIVAAVITFGPVIVMLALNTYSPFEASLLHLNGFLNAVIYGIYSTPLRRMARVATRQEAVTGVTSFSVGFNPHVDVVDIQTNSVTRKSQVEISEVSALGNQVLPAGLNESDNEVSKVFFF